MTIKTGYKATDKDMQCRGLQFVLGEWQSVDGDLVECENGLHFCTELAHTYEFYNDDSDRRFECEVEDVLEIEYQPGVISKRVARRVRLTKELTISGNSNTGNRNTGDSNTGDCNAGDWNTGDCNTGHSNAGNRNTGDSNTGDCNTGNRNTGDWNAGDWNTGDCNTGNRNTGDSNTGDSNTGDCNAGDWNTGDCNYCDYSSGFFGSVDPKITSFDIECEYTRAEFLDKFGSQCRELHKLMQSDKAIDVARFAGIPNITQERLNNLHQKYIDSRNASPLSSKN